MEAKNSYVYFLFQSIDFSHSNENLILTDAADVRLISYSHNNDVKEKFQQENILQATNVLLMWLLSTVSYLKLKK